MTVVDRIAGIGYPVSPVIHAPVYIGRHRGFGTARMSRVRMRYIARHTYGRISPVTFLAALFR